jgi:hypothetical protein
MRGMFLTSKLDAVPDGELTSEVVTHVTGSRPLAITVIVVALNSPEPTANLQPDKRKFAYIIVYI